MIIESLLGALIPIGAEALKQGVSKWIGGVKPTTIDEQIKLDQSEIARTEALAKLDTPIGQPSQWVIDLRASARYIGALTVIACGISTFYVPGIAPEVAAIALEAANIAFGFLFGSRIVNGWSRK
jgi:hypothetical protein